MLSLRLVLSVYLSYWDITDKRKMYFFQSESYFADNSLVTFLMQPDYPDVCSSSSGAQHLNLKSTRA